MNQNELDQLTEIIERLNTKVDNATVTTYVRRGWQNLIIIAGSGGNFTSIQSGINQAVGDGAAAGNRYCVLVMPGDYAENITMDDYVDVIGISRSSVKINPAAGTPVTHSANSMLANVTIEQAGTTSVAVDMADSLTCRMYNVLVTGAFGARGIYCRGGGEIIRCESYVTGNNAESIQQINGSNKLTIRHSKFWGNFGTPNTQNGGDFDGEADVYDCYFSGRTAINTATATASAFFSNCHIVRDGNQYALDGGGTFDYCTFDGPILNNTRALYLSFCEINNNAITLNGSVTVNIYACTNTNTFSVSSTSTTIQHCSQVNCNAVNMTGTLNIYQCFVTGLVYTGGVHTVNLSGNSYFAAIGTNANRTVQGDDVIEKVFHVTSLGTGGSYTRIGANNEIVVHQLQAGHDCNIENIMYPDDMVWVGTHELRYIPDGTGTWDWTVNTRGATCGEDKDTNTDSATNDAEAVTDDEIKCTDISAAFTPYAAGDTIGCKVTCDALDTTTSIYILEVRVQMILSD